jgi:predicted MFS family arabinose efflux permease
MGSPAAFFGLAMVGVAAFLVIWLLLPETRSGQAPTATPEPVAA